MSGFASPVRRRGVLQLTGGAAADDSHVFTVPDRAGLARALNGGSASPKIVKITGSIR